MAERRVFVWLMPVPRADRVRVTRPSAPRVTRAPFTPTLVLTPRGETVMRTPGAILKLFRTRNPMPCYFVSQAMLSPSRSLPLFAWYSAADCSNVVTGVPEV